MLRLAAYRPVRERSIGGGVKAVGAATPVGLTATDGADGVEGMIRIGGVAADTLTASAEEPEPAEEEPTLSDASGLRAELTVEL